MTLGRREGIFGDLTFCLNAYLATHALRCPQIRSYFCLRAMLVAFQPIIQIAMLRSRDSNTRVVKTPLNKMTSPHSILALDKGVLPLCVGKLVLSNEIALKIALSGARGK